MLLTFLSICSFRLEEPADQVQLNTEARQVQQSEVEVEDVSAKEP